MLPPFIIEQIRQREEERRKDNRPVLELPIDDLEPGRPGGRPHSGKPGRGRADITWDETNGPFGERRDEERTPDGIPGGDGSRGVVIIEL